MSWGAYMLCPSALRTKIRDQLNMSYRGKFIQAKRTSKHLGHFLCNRFHTVHWFKSNSGFAMACK